MKTTKRTRGRSTPECKIINFPRTAKQMLESYRMPPDDRDVHVLRRTHFELRDLEVCSEIAKRNGLELVDVIEGLIRSLLKAYADGPSGSWGGGVIGDCLPRLLSMAVGVRLTSEADYWPPAFYLKESNEA